MMHISKVICGMGLIALSACNSTMPTGAEMQAANTFLAQNAWGNSATSTGPTRTNASSQRPVVRNENYEAVAGIPMQVGVRWAIKKDCSPKPFSMEVVQRPRYGKVYFKPVSYVIPTTALRGGGQDTHRRCAGLPTVGQAIFYEAPAGNGNYYDYFSIKTSTDLEFNYRMLVQKPVG